MSVGSVGGNNEEDKVQELKEKEKDKAKGSGSVEESPNSVNMVDADENDVNSDSFKSASDGDEDSSFRDRLKANGSAVKEVASEIWSGIKSLFAGNKSSDVAEDAAPAETEVTAAAEEAAKEVKDETPKEVTEEAPSATTAPTSQPDLNSVVSAVHEQLGALAGQVQAAVGNQRVQNAPKTGEADSPQEVTEEQVQNAFANISAQLANGLQINDIMVRDLKGEKGAYNELAEDLKPFVDPQTGQITDINGLAERLLPQATTSEGQAARANTVNDLAIVLGELAKSDDKEGLSVEDLQNLAGQANGTTGDDYYGLIVNEKDMSKAINNWINNEKKSGKEVAAATQTGAYEAEITRVGNATPTENNIADTSVGAKLLGDKEISLYDGNNNPSEFVRNLLGIEEGSPIGQNDPITRDNFVNAFMNEFKDGDGALQLPEGVSESDAEAYFNDLYTFMTEKSVSGIGAKDELSLSEFNWLAGNDGNSRTLKFDDFNVEAKKDSFKRVADKLAGGNEINDMLVKNLDSYDGSYDSLPEDLKPYVDAETGQINDVDKFIDRLVSDLPDDYEVTDADKEAYREAMGLPEGTPINDDMIPNVKEFVQQQFKDDLKVVLREAADLDNAEGLSVNDIRKLAEYGHAKLAQDNKSDYYDLALNEHDISKFVDKWLTDHIRFIPYNPPSTPSGGGGDSTPPGPGPGSDDGCGTPWEDTPTPESR